MNFPNYPGWIETCISVFRIISLCPKEPQNKEWDDSANVCGVREWSGKYPGLDKNSWMFSERDSDMESVCKMFPNLPGAITTDKNMLDGFQATAALIF